MDTLPKVLQDVINSFISWCNNRYCPLQASSEAMQCQEVSNNCEAPGELCLMCSSMYVIHITHEGPCCSECYEQWCAEEQLGWGSELRF